MKLFYFGSVCAQDIFNQTVEKSRVKPSASAQNFEYALIKGFSMHEEVELTVVSAESIAMYPKGNRLLLRKRKDVLTEKVSTQILSALNLPLIKQKNHAYGVKKELQKWLKENANEKNKAVLVYGLYPDPIKKIQSLCREYNCKIFALITDIPRTMFTYTQSKGIKKWFGKYYRKKAVQLQELFDGYIYLTMAMKDEVAPQKPYVVVETIADGAIFDTIEVESKATPPAIMYAGALYKKYGLDKLIEIFENMETEAQLWLFGSGDYEEEIKEKQKKNPKIRFFGRVEREQVLKKEREATLLLNVRNPEEEYTKYSFPSKMIEYMLSGTPVVTTKLAGIPLEYEEFVYFIKYEDSVEMAKQLDEVLKREKNSSFSLGEKAREFVLEKKNALEQTKKIIEFIRKES